LVEDLTLLILNFLFSFVTKMVYSVVEIHLPPGAAKWGTENCDREFGEFLGIPVSVQNACYMSAAICNIVGMCHVLLT
jgi:hypothetical protein